MIGWTRKPIVARQGSLRWAVCTLPCLLALGCGHKHSEPLAPEDAIPASTPIDAQKVTTGLQLGTLRTEIAVDSFRISTQPITVGQYEKCVDAKVCSAPERTDGLCQHSNAGVDGATYTRALSEHVAAQIPVTCASAVQMQRYCEWVGGRLPRVEEWLLAARGPDVQRFAWGDDLPTCDTHWRTAYGASGCCAKSCDSLSELRLGAHPQGVSPSGVADVLFTRAEVFTGNPTQAVVGCPPRSSLCYAAGTVPGAIDMIASSERSARPASHAAFRCVWEEK